MLIEKSPDLVVSGGQSGADRGGLAGAQECDVATGGYAPLGWKTEYGPKPELGELYGLLESSSEDYAVRTKQNVEMADAVLLISQNFWSPGTVLTKKLTLECGKGVFELQYAQKSSGFKLYWFQDLLIWLNALQPSILMVAGNRESKAPGIQEFTRKTIQKILVDV